MNRLRLTGYRIFSTAADSMLAVGFPRAYKGVLRVALWIGLGSWRRG